MWSCAQGRAADPAAATAFGAMVKSMTRACWLSSPVHTPHSRTGGAVAAWACANSWRGSTSIATSLSRTAEILERVSFL